MFFNLDQVKHIREQVFIKMASYWQRMTHLFNSQLRPRNFNVGDLVLMRTNISKGKSMIRKVGWKSERSFKIFKVIRPNTYKMGRYYSIYEIFVI